MHKRLHLAGCLAALSLVAGPAAAQNTPVFFEPYGEIFSARTMLRSTRDTRPLDARSGQPSRVENPNQRLAAEAGFVDTSFFFLGGGGLAYANTASAAHPWQVSFFANHLSFDGFDENFTFMDFTGKVVLWNPSNPNHPVVGLVVNYQDEDDIGDFFRVVLALDQRITREAYLTLNVGYADVRELGFNEEGLFSGVGITWAPRRWPRLSVSANYNFDGSVAGEDTYSISAIWGFGRTLSLEVGGGKHCKVFFNLRGILDWD